ncbi:lengsin-like isoform X1 [Carassius gibelio]|uniref:lengsin-like isoform X1 n=2 Tax=Carassius gibelio TaxID=101364 RepID=UPI00227786B5|nr:lengsin-like isoform X1 [Carassius gibelio]
MQDSEESRNMEKIPDQMDGVNMSAGKKGANPREKRLSSSGWDRKGTSVPLVPSNVPIPGTTNEPILISIGPSHHCPSVSGESQEQGLSREDNYNRHGWRRENMQYYQSTGEGGIPKQTMDELKSVLHESSLRSAKEQDERGSYPPGHRVDCNPDQMPSKSFSTFKPLSEARRASRLREGSSGWDSAGSSMTDGPPGRSSGMSSPTDETSHGDEAGTSHSEKESSQALSFASQSFISDVEHIKQQIAQENISFVRFEATDLHGVSRSKTVPARFFHEKAVYGIPMPRSYLELTLSPKVNEVDHSSAANFSSDVLLVADLSTFQIVPWADQTARLICDPCTITGVPLRTSPRLIAKQMLGQLQSMGFSLHSSFTYECCIFGAPERVGPKAVFFPATTLLSNYDQPFLQQLVRGMYSMGVDVESFSSANGPGQMEICFKPRFGIDAADSAFTFRTGIKEMARKFDYIATFFTDDSIHNSGLLSHSLWDASGRRSLFHSGNGELSEIGRKWLSGLLQHSAARSCLLAPGIGCRNQLSKGKNSKNHFYATCGCNDNSSAFNVKVHGGRETHIDNKLGSAMANPYIVLAATIAAGLDGIRWNLNGEHVLSRAPAKQKQFPIPVKLDDALVALAEDNVIRGALGEPFVQYFIAMKQVEMETQEQDAVRNKGLEYFI